MADELAALRQWVAHLITSHDDDDDEKKGQPR